MAERRFLIIPCVERGRGSGHLLRCLGLRRSLGASGAQAQILLDPESQKRRGPAELCPVFGIKAGEWIDGSLAQGLDWDIVIFDGFATSSPLFYRFAHKAYCVGLDEGGRERSRFDYLIDIMPRLTTRHEPNRREALAFLDLPVRARPFPERIGKILLSFGGEDPAGLSAAIESELSSLKLRADLQIDSIRARLAPEAQKSKGIRYLEPKPELRSYLKDYDLVITQFGLTAYEALAAGCAVLLLDPSLYHQALSLKAGFASLGLEKTDTHALATYLEEPSLIHEGNKRALSSLGSAIEEARGKTGSAALAAFILDIELPELPRQRICAACKALVGKQRPTILWRDNSRSYYRCPGCGSLNMQRSGKNPISYTESYFFEEYRAQYGKTYLEDMSHLRRLASSRLQRICRHMGTLSGLRVLDIGCAYGAFLAEAAESGCSCMGLEASAEAADYVSVNLGIPVIQGFFPQALEGRNLEGPFDIISMWYVAEHLPDLAQCLTRVAAMLAPGGIFALSTPSASGVSARFSPASFFQNSPQDHVSILSPSSIKKVFKDAGLCFLEAVSTGHHPERFPWRKATAKSPALCLAASRFFRLGDTFEAYAKKR